jgi:hypothetical protein
MVNKQLSRIIAAKRQQIFEDQAFAAMKDWNNERLLKAEAQCEKEYNELETTASGNNELVTMVEAMDKFAKKMELKNFLIVIRKEKFNRRL